MAGEQILTDKTLEEIQRLGQIVGNPKECGGIPYAVIPQDCKVESLEKFRWSQYADFPHRKKGIVKVLDATSFIEYYQLFSDENSRVFADETQSLVLAILDYHGAGSDGGPRWGGHRVRLDLRHSPEWLTWTGKDGHAMTQVGFAEFMEDNAPDIVNPSAATMLEMARTLQAKTDVDYSSAIRTNNGQVQLTYNETVKGTYGSGKVEIPEEFSIYIPAYIGTPRVPVRARLRYRLNGGKLKIWYNLLQPDEIERKAFVDTLGSIKDGLKVNIINGNPD